MSRQSRLVGWLFLLPLVAAVWLRVGDLETRPLHNDEAINARKLAQLWDGGGYRYDPHEYHGPTLYYAALPVLRVASISQPDQPQIGAFRLVSVGCGLALVLVFSLVREGLGRGATWMAAMLTAVSPAMVYYSRYYIHEPVLVLATGLFLAAGWRLTVRPGPGWALLAGTGLGLMWATKETFVFAVAAAGAAWLGTVIWPPPSVGETTGIPAGGVSSGGPGRMLARLRRAAGRLGVRELGLFAASAFGVGAILLSSFGSNPGGIVDSVRSYFVWGERAGGATPHVQPWSFYLGRLAWFHGRGAPVWTELWILVLAGVGLVAGWGSVRPGGADGRLVRFVTLYTVLLAAVYALIPYKTPWCLLGFLHGLIVLAGVGAVALWQATQGGDRWRRVGRGAVVMALGAGMVHLGVQAWRGAREYAADFRNPYVYGHTSADIGNLLELVGELKAVHPDREGMPVQVVVPGSDYWPLPWYLRKYRAAGWWEAMPEPPYASVVIVAVKLNAALDAKTGQGWRPAGMFELRPRFFVEVYVEAELWKRFLAARAAARLAEP